MSEPTGKPILDALINASESFDERDCTCDNYSWHGEGHASACPLSDDPPIRLSDDREIANALWGPAKIRAALGVFYKDPVTDKPALLVPMCALCDKVADECVCDEEERPLCD